MKIPLNRDAGESSYKDEWYWQQCGGCKHWRPVSGDLGADWGVCTGASSPFDSTVRFEHDGCAEFEDAPEGWHGH